MSDDYRMADSAPAEFWRNVRGIGYRRMIFLARLTTFLFVVLLALLVLGGLLLARVL